MSIFVYNRKRELHDGPNNYPIYRPNILGNPYTEIKDKKTKAMFIVSDRETAINKYNEYFDIMYGGNLEFQKTVDEIYEKYKNGEDIYLECYCKKYTLDDTKPHDDEVSCHGDIIKAKLQKRLLKEKINNIRLNNNNV